MGGGDTSWSEKIVTNTVGGLAFGTIYGAIKGAWLTAPNPKLIDAPIRYSEVANIMGKQSLQFALLGGVFTVGAASLATFRSKDDAYNYGAGGALVGAYAGLRGGKLHSVVYKSIGFGLLGVACAVLASKKTLGHEAIDAAVAKRFTFMAVAADNKKDE